MKTISVRIDNDLEDYMVRNNYVMTEIVRAGLIHFVKMEVNDKIKLLAENKENFKDLEIEDIDWKREIRRQLTEFFPNSVINKIEESKTEVDILNSLLKLK